jgi:UDP-N-acetylmuramate dehydrogenase
MSMPSWIPCYIKEDFPLKEYTTLKIGGQGRYVAVVHTVDQIKEVLFFSHQVSLPIFVIGKGSNLLLSDEKMRGVFLINQLQGVDVFVDHVIVKAGVNVTYLAQKLSKMGKGGLEFLSGIPGSVGGAIVMNAGAHQKEIKDVFSWVDVINHEGKIKRLDANTLEFGYRKSSLMQQPVVIIQACLKIYDDPQSNEKRELILKKRLLSQPYSAHTAGCTFKNPANQSAGQLIDQCGLKGLVIGGMKVSEQHANFFENTGDASMQNFLDLVEKVRYEVKNRTKIDLQLEVVPCFLTYTPIQQPPMDS